MRCLTFVLLFVACHAASPHFNAVTEAARAGEADRVRELVREGADPNAPAGGNEWTPLLHAVHKHQVKAAEALIDAGADINRAAPNGITPLMMAAGYGHDDMVAMLLRRGADAKRTDKDGASALDFAITGTSDIDELTLFSCQASTVKLLQPTNAPVKKSSTRWAGWKRC
jgi:hypothetical protein